MRTLVNLISEQMLPNVISTLALKPDKVILLTSQDEKYKKNAEFFKIYLNEEIELEIRQTDAYDYIKTYDICAEIMKEGTILNVTAGTKLMALGAFLAAKDTKVPTIYVDTANRNIIKLNEANMITEDITFPRMMLKDFIQPIGIGVKETQKIAEEMNEAIIKLAKVAITPNSLWLKFTQYINHNKKKNGENWSIPVEKTINNKKSFLDLRFVKSLADLNIIQDVKEKNKMVTFKFTDPVYENFVCMNGFILEAYIYLSLKNADISLDQIEVGVKFNWGDDNVERKQSVQNEIDIVTCKAPFLGLVSCKMGKENLTPALNELDLYAKRFGGIYARKVLVTTSTRSAVSHLVFERAKNMGIHVFVYEDIICNDFGDKLSRVLSE